MKLFRKFILTVLVFLCLAGQASAHATPVLYEPEAASVMKNLPERVNIVFSERIEEKASGISVYSPDGTSADIGDAKLSPTDAHSYNVGIKDKGAGTYTVSWQVVSADDGHFTKGAFAFSVGIATAGMNTSLGQIQIQHITTIPQAVTMAIELIGETCILGVLFFLGFLWRRLKNKFPEEIDSSKEKTEKRLSYIMITGGICILIGVASFVILKTFDLEQLRPGDFTVTLKIFLSTVDGSYAILRGILGLLSVILFLVIRKSIWKGERITKVEWCLWIFIFLMILIRARVSHAAASSFLPTLSIFITAIQLLCKELWVGGLIVMSTVVVPALLRLKNILPFAYLSTLFSKMMAIVFGGVGVTGAYVIWLDLKDPSYLFSTEWGAYCIVLAIFGAVLLGIRLYHSFVVERLAVSTLQKKEGENTKIVSWSGWTLKLEMLVGIALIFVTSLIIITTPPYATERFTFEKSVVSQDAKITMTVHPNEPSQFLITVEREKRHGEIPVSHMVVTATNEEKNIGPIVVNTEQRFIGGYVFPKALLTPPGNWKINISAQREDSYDAVATFNVDYPKEIESSRINPDKRSFGLFEASCTIAAVLVILFALFLYRFSKRLHAISTGFDRTKNTEKRENNHEFSSALAWILSFTGLVLVTGLIWYSYNTFIKSDFQKLCQKNGHFWLQSIPIKDGRALSPDTVTGCFLDVGLYHFADKREYEFFFQKRQIIPEFSYKPAQPVAGVPTDIALSLPEIKNGKNAGPVTELGINHDRILHVLIVGEDLKTFAHIHTEDLGPVTEEMKKQATFPLRYTFPKSGFYALNIDYIVSGIEYTNVAIVDVKENAGIPKMEKPAYEIPKNPVNITQTKEFDGYTVTFNAPRKIKAGEKVSLSYYVEKDGEPVTNMEPYLGAAMHLGMIRNDLGRFFHTHGEASQPGSVWFQQLLGKYYKYHMHFAPDQFGPKIITPYWATKFTTPGLYTIFGEFRVGGKVIVTDFGVQVGE